MSSGDGFDGVRQMSQAISQGIAEHVNAPPQRKNQNRAEWGTGLLAGGAYVAHTFVLVEHASLAEAVRFYFRALHEPLATSWPFYAWGGAMLFALLWVVVGVHGSRAPREIMMAFWALFRIALAGVALWGGWYFDGYPVVNWFLEGIYIMVVSSSAMLLYICLRGTGRGAVRLVQQQIAQQAKTFRLGRRRSF
jgi:Zn-dependent protease